MKYSIITINYNHAEGLRRTIESVVGQTCKDYEYIVIDGGSTDGSVDVIKEYADKIDFWVSEPDKGIYNAMNKGIDHAHGEYLNFMNSGDCFYNEEVLQNINKEANNADIVVGRQMKEDMDYAEDIPEKITMSFFIGRFLPHQSSFIKRKLFDDERYDESYSLMSDHIFFVKCLIFKNCSYKKVNLTICKFESNGISSNADLLERERKRAHHDLLPERILLDYYRFDGKESPMLNMIPYFNKTVGFHKLVCLVVSTMIRIRKLIKREK